MLRAWVQSLIRELRSCKPCSTAKKKKRERKFRNVFVPQLSHLKIRIGTSFVVQWLRLCAPIAGGMSSIPGRETRIPRATGHDLRKKKNSCLKKKLGTIIVPMSQRCLGKPHNQVYEKCLVQYLTHFKCYVNVS